MIRGVLVLSLMLLSPLALAELDNICGKSSLSSLSYSYCISKTRGSSSRDILYVLHGGQGDEREWIEGYDGVQDAWLSRKFDAPIVINVSFGPIWILLKKNALPPSALLEKLQKEIYPQLERKALGSKVQPGKRMLIGGSMGGFNTAQLLFNSPAGTYSKAVILCPAIIGVSPWATEAEIEKFITQEKANADTVRGIIGVVKSLVPDQTTWDQEVDPISLSTRRLSPQTTTQILVATNREDHTFIAGGRYFAKAALASGAPVRYEDWDGGHCQVDVEAIADFLMN